MGSSEENSLVIIITVKFASVDLHHPHVSAISGLADALKLNDFIEISGNLLHELKNFVIEKVMDTGPGGNEKLVHELIIKGFVLHESLH